MKVLMVEDEEPLARAIGREISRAGHEVRRVGTLAGALSLVGTDDVVLLDLHLPDADGMEAPVRLRAAAPGLPIVVWTGRDIADVQHSLARFDPPILWEPKGGSLEVPRLLRKLRTVDLHRRMGSAIDELEREISALMRSGIA